MITNKLHLLVSGLVFSAAANAVTVTDVGTLPRPVANPLNGTTWSLSSACIDINDSGIAACKSIAVGPTYRCGWRGAQRCASSVEKAVKWTGSQLVDVAPATTAARDNPLGINNNGDMFGYVYAGQVYGPNAGRIWKADGSIKTTAGPVIWVNDLGAYVDETAAVVGGSTMVYFDKAHNSDSTLIPVTGLPTSSGGFTATSPHIIANDGEIAGAQIIQAFRADNGVINEIPEVSGTGWFISQADVDAMPRNEDGTLDVYSLELWPMGYGHPYSTNNNVRSFVSDINEHNDIVVQSAKYSVSSGSLISQICSHGGETAFTGGNGQTYTGPYTCIPGYEPTGNGYGYSKRGFNGINNRGDAVGVYTPYLSTTSKPYVWLKGNDGSFSGQDLNLLVAGLGYTVVSVFDINDARQIAGTCKNASGIQRGCIINL